MSRARIYGRFHPEPPYEPCTCHHTGCPYCNPPGDPGHTRAIQKQWQTTLRQEAPQPERKGTKGMANIMDSFPSKYLRASDLKGRDVRVTIEHVAHEEVGRDRDVRPIVYFRGSERGLVLNKTNANKIVSLLGSGDTDTWTGKQITLYPTEVTFGAELVDAIRIKAASGNGTRQAEAGTSRQQPPPENDPDNIPFDDDSDVPF